MEENPTSIPRKSPSGLRVSWISIAGGILLGISAGLLLAYFQRPPEPPAPGRESAVDQAGTLDPVSSPNPLVRFAWLEARQSGLLQEDPVSYANSLLHSPRHTALDAEDLIAALLAKASGDYLSALRMAQNLGDGQLRDEVVVGLFKRASETPKVAVDMIDFLPLHARKRLTEEFVTAWTKREGSSVLLELLGSDKVPIDSLGGAFRVAARTDPQKTLAALEALPAKSFLGQGSGFGKTALIRGFLNQVSPEAAIPLLKNLPASYERDQMLVTRYATLLKTDPKSIPEFAKDLADPRVMKAYRNALTYYATHENETADVLSQVIPGERSRGLAFEEAAKVRASKDPAGTANWVAGLGDPINRLSAVRGAVERLVRENPTNALDAIGSISEPGVREVWRNDVLAQLRTRFGNPAEDVSWIKDLKTPEQRQLIIEAARNLPPGDQERIQSLLP